MSLEENKALARRYQSAWERRDLRGLRLLLADGCINLDLTTGEERPAIDFEQATCEMWHESFSEIQVDVRQLVAEGDQVSIIWLLTALHDRPFLGISATHRRVYVAGMESIRVADGKITEICRLTDSAALMDQLRGR